jgi:hypothetical protein
MPDLLGASLAWAAVALATLGRGALAGGLLGLALGVRIDLAPLAALAAGLDRRSALRFAGGMAAGIATWLPALWLVGPPDLASALLAFGQGHLQRWGSSALAGAGSAAQIGTSLALAGTGGIGALLAGVGLARLPHRRLRAPAWAVGAYALWVALGQNLAHPRHLLPLLPALVLLGALGLEALGRASQRVAVAALGALLLSAALLHAQLPRAPRDGRVLVARALRACGDCAALYAGESKRLFDRYAPGFPAYRRARLDSWVEDRAAWGLREATVLATSEVEGAAERGTHVARLAPGLELYRIEASELPKPHAPVQPPALLHAGQPGRGGCAGDRRSRGLLLQSGAQPHRGGGAVRRRHDPRTQPRRLL